MLEDKKKGELNEMDLHPEYLSALHNRLDELRELCLFVSYQNDDDRIEEMYTELQAITEELAEVINE